MTTINDISLGRNDTAVGDYPADTALWEAFADATTSRDARIAGPLGMRLACSARHRHPNRHRAMIRTALTGLLVLAALLILGGTARSVPTAPGFYGLTPGQVSQVATVLEAPGYQLTADVQPAGWTETTCHAFASWQHDRTTARLDRLVTASLHVPWKYLGGDVWQLVNDVHAQPKYVSDDAQYIFEDCANGSGL